MKHKQKISWFLSGALAAILVASLASPALAALTAKTIEVWTGLKIYVDGAEMHPTDANGNPVEVFAYNGTTYVPLRAVSKFLGKTTGPTKRCISGMSRARQPTG